MPDARSISITGTGYPQKRLKVEENAAVQFVKGSKDLLYMPSITRDGFDLLDVVSTMVDVELYNHSHGVEMTQDIGLSFFLLWHLIRYVPMWVVTYPR